MTSSDWVTLGTIVLAIATIILVLVTGYYAWQTHDTNKSTRELAEYTKRLAGQTEEMAKQTQSLADQTEKLVQETIVTRRMALIPALTCEVKVTLFPPTANGEGDMARCGQFNAVRIHNVGTGPVAEARMHVELANEEHSVWLIEEQDKPVWIVGTDAEGILINLNQAELRTSTAEHKRDQQPIIEIELQYKNTYGIEFRTIATFELIPNNTNNQFQVITEPCKWVKVMERMPVQHS